MKTLFLVLLLATNTVWAKAAFQLNDEAILGQYTLVAQDANSEIQTAEIVYNNDNVLVVRTDRNDSEYELTGQDKSGVIVDFQDEPNCGGDEDFCGYDSQVTIKLLAANVNGEKVPQLSFEITVSNAWDEVGDEDETTTYVLNWSKTLPYQIPFYLNIETSADIKKISDDCQAAIPDLEFDSETGYLSNNDVCSRPYSVKYRDDVNEAMPYIIAGWGNPEKTKLVTAQGLKKDYFGPAKALASKYKNDPKVTSAQIIEQLQILESFVLKADRVYAYQYVDDNVTLFVVNEKTKIVSIVYFKVNNN